MQKQLILAVISLFVGACGVQGQRYSSVEHDTQSDSRTKLVESRWYGQVGVYTHTSVTKSAEDGLKKAMETWNEALGTQLLTWAGTIDIDRTADLYGSLNDEFTVVYLERTWTSTTGKSNQTLGTTVWEIDPNISSKITRADIVLNGEIYSFQDSEKRIEESERAGGIVDAETVLLHELGHLLGLSHVDSEEDPYSIMAPVTGIGFGDHSRILSTGDRERITKLYGNLE